MDECYYENSAVNVPPNLFEAYRRSFCSLDLDGFPGLAYEEGLAYLELGDAELMNSATMEIPRQLCQDAGIKIDMQMVIRHLPDDDFVQQPQLEEFPPCEESRPSSSSSSLSPPLRSLCMGSPEFSSLNPNKVNTSFTPDPLKEAALELEAQPKPPLAPPHRETLQAYNQRRNVQFPALARDDEAITRAMMAVISSSTSSSPSSSSSSIISNPVQEVRMIHQQAQENGRSGAFGPYNPAVATMLEPKKDSRDQKMIKKSISILRSINSVGNETHSLESKPGSNHLHHMISERRRREKLNESFHVLRMLLPPGRKKDKTSVLINARNHLSTLKAQISELEENNSRLEAYLLSVSSPKEDGDSSRRAKVQLIKVSDQTLEVQHINLRITVMLECDVIELVLHVLECLKEMRTISLVSIDASTYSPQMNVFARVNLKLQIKGHEWNEASFEEAMTRAVEDVTATLPLTCPARSWRYTG